MVWLGHAETMYAIQAVRWIPSDIAASAILKQVFSSASALEYFHVENTYPTAWKDVAEAVSYSSPRPLRPLGFTAWLEQTKTSKRDPEDVPAIKLLDVFRGVAQGGNALAALSCQVSAKVAPELAFGPMTGELLKKYVLYQLQKSRTCRYP